MHRRAAVPAADNRWAGQAEASAGETPGAAAAGVCPENCPLLLAGACSFLLGLAEGPLAGLLAFLPLLYASPVGERRGLDPRQLVWRAGVSS